MTEKLSKLKTLRSLVFILVGLVMSTGNAFSDVPRIFSVDDNWWAVQDNHGARGKTGAPSLRYARGTHGSPEGFVSACLEQCSNGEADGTDGICGGVVILYTNDTKQMPKKCNFKVSGAVQKFNSKRNRDHYAKICADGFPYTQECAYLNKTACWDGANHAGYPAANNPWTLGTSTNTQYANCHSVCAANDTCYQDDWQDNTGDYLTCTVGAESIRLNSIEDRDFRNGALCQSTAQPEVAVTSIASGNHQYPDSLDRPIPLSECVVELAPPSAPALIKRCEHEWGANLSKCSGVDTAERAECESAADTRMSWCYREGWGNGGWDGCRDCHLRCEWQMAKSMNAESACYEEHGSSTSAAYLACAEEANAPLDQCIADMKIQRAVNCATVAAWEATNCPYPR